MFFKLSSSNRLWILLFSSPISSWWEPLTQLLYLHASKCKIYPYINVYTSVGGNVAILLSLRNIRLHNIWYPNHFQYHICSILQYIPVYFHTRPLTRLKHWYFSKKLVSMWVCIQLLKHDRVQGGSYRYITDWHSHTHIHMIKFIIIYIALCMYV